MTIDRGPRSGAEESSAYARLHLTEGVARHYDDVIYAPEGYDTFIWGLQRPFLRELAASLERPAGSLRLLDFACGTGRIITALEDLAGESLGVDISPDMLSAARSKAHRSQFDAGDILTRPDIAPGPYDLITAMRFFLNTEDEMRDRVMVALRDRLAGPDSRLVFNIHINSVNFIPQRVHRRLHGWPPYRSLSYWGALRLARRAGLEVVGVNGYGLVPERLYRGRFGRPARWVDRKAAGRTPLAWLCRDLVLVCRLRP